MSTPVSLYELLKLAIGSPELGAVNFNALYCLLHGLLEHLEVGNVERVLSPEEMAFIQPGHANAKEMRDTNQPGSASAKEMRDTNQPGSTSTKKRASIQSGTANMDISDRPPTLFHQLHNKISMMEYKFLQLESLPSPFSLLQGSQSQNKPVEEMWQLIQLKRKVESNEDGVTKAMTTFQELCSTFNSLKEANYSMQERLSSLSEQVTRINIEEVERRLNALEGQSYNLPLLADKMEDLHRKLMSYPEPTDLVTWPSLHDTMTDKNSTQHLSSDVKQKNVKNVLSDLAKLPNKHEVLENRVQSIEEELKRLELEISSKGIPEDLLQEMLRLRQDVEKLFQENIQDRLDINGLRERLHELNMALDGLTARTDKLAEDMSETATLQSQLDELERKKLNKDEFVLQLNLKADKTELETKVGHADLEDAIANVNAILEDLLKKLGFQEADWREMLEKLLAELESKLNQSDLDAIRKDLEDLWRFIKKHLSSDKSFDPDGAAGFRKSPFERVKCISCDRSVKIATWPHLVTVRTATLNSRNPPQCCEHGKDRNNGDPSQMTDPEFQYTETSRPQTSRFMHRKTSSSQNLETVFPYGDPAQITYRNSAFDLLGIDGKMYKGSLDAGYTGSISEREAAVRSPQPPTRLAPERARSATPHYRSQSAPNTRLPNPSRRTSRSSLQVPSTPDISPPTFRVPTATETTSLFQRPLSAKEQRIDS